MKDIVGAIYFDDFASRRPHPDIVDSSMERFTPLPVRRGYWRGISPVERKFFMGTDFFTPQYSPSSSYINHFIQPDSIIPDYTNPQSWNRYSYVGNNPVNFNDPSGHMADDESDGAGKRGCNLECLKKDNDDKTTIILTRDEIDDAADRADSLEEEYRFNGDRWAYIVGTGTGVVSLFINTPSCTVGSVVTIGTSCVIAIGAEAVTIPVLTDMAGQAGGWQTADHYNAISEQIDGVLGDSSASSFTVEISTGVKRQGILPGGVGVDTSTVTIKINNSKISFYSAGSEIQELFGVSP